jgi:N-dimethylarginine dimethylaminohydrolase
MDENTIIHHLEELTERFGVKIRYDAMKEDEDSIHVVGGLCLLRGEYILIINSKATTMDRIKTLATALKHFNLDRIYLRPVLMELLDKIPEQRPLNDSSKESNGMG